MLILLPNRLLLTGLFVLLIFSKSTANGSSADDEKEMANYVKALRKELFQTRAYDPTISPYLAYADSLQATNISLGLDLFYVIDLDTSTSILEATFVLKLGWINENLTWVPDRFGGLELLHIAAGEVFRPDIYVSNALAEENLVSSSSHSDMLLSAEGELFWAPVITLRTLCPLDLTDWPSDRQTCLLRFVSGSFFTTEVLLFNSSKHIETGNLKPNPQWAVVATGVHFRSVSYYDLVFELTLQRTSDVFAWAISVPLYAALCLNLGTFFFSGPLCSSVVDFRFSLVRLAFLTLILLSLYVASQLGGVVGVLGMPTLVAFIGRNTVLVTVNLLWSAFLRSSSSSSSSSSSPKAPTDLLSRALRPLERLLGGGGGGGVDDSERLVEEVDELPSNPPPQRKEVDINGGPSRVVHLLDKLLFVVSLAVMFFR